MPLVDEDGKCFGKYDLDDLLAYTTEKKVVIRDRRLTFFRILLTFLILLYVLVWEIVIQKGYLLRDSPTGVVRLSIFDGELPKESPSYCADGNRPVSTKPPWEHLTCKLPDSSESVASPSQDTIMVTTRAKILTGGASNSANCIMNSLSPSCKGSNPTKSYYYVRGAEQATLNIRHSVYGQASQVVAGWGQMTGRLVQYSPSDGLTEVYKWSSGTQKEAIEFGGCNPVPQGMSVDEYDPHERIGDCATVNTWMKMAGVTDLDMTLSEVEKAQRNPSTSEANVPKLANELARYDGLIFLVVIKYEASSGTEDLGYTTQVILLPGASLKVVGTTSSSNGRVVVTRNGIGFIVVQSGYVGRFSMAELLKTLVTANALFAVAVIVVNSVVMKLLPFSALYKNYITTRTVDFSEVEMDEEGHFLVRGKGGANQLVTDQFVYGDITQGTPVRDLEKAKAKLEGSPNLSTGKKPLEEPLVN